jgi:hypothetical protein
VVRGGNEDGEEELLLNQSEVIAEQVSMQLEDRGDTVISEDQRRVIEKLYARRPWSHPSFGE